METKPTISWDEPINTGYWWDINWRITGGYKQGILTPISLDIENVEKGFRNGLVEVTWKPGVLFPWLKYQ